ncbi:NAD(P)-dependent oxidoreductase [Aureibaculum marinum]|uniref:NAD(P)-dependent oxidoreductase n=1 Tax=Aureibaculum marinum TaxID=2487930 RepID=A0A3N4NQH0_9FLAO|nr:NAD(P)-dependent oxidoreductase [Aureibaculum marinum]RPD94360.1 NAD(P)-dependent oxidoreductase [Aureibaculum marinum]
MIIIDTALNRRAKENNPIKVGIVGSGEMAKGLLNQIEKFTPGMKVVGHFNRSLERPKRVYKDLNLDYRIVETSNEFDKAFNEKTIAVTQNLELLLKTEHVDIIVDMTGSIEFSAQLTLDCISNKKDILTFNAELDATLGPILKHKADKAGVKYSVAEGDQPGCTMNLYRFVKQIGLTPLVCGNVKGMLDEYRTPKTQENFAASWDMSPYMATNFADGTKVSLEQACIANATGMKVAKRGMLGFKSTDHIDNLTGLYDLNQLKELGGIVDFTVGAKPGPGVFVYASSDGDPFTEKYLKYGKLGDGPLYSFYIPYHLLFFEIPISIARMVDFDDIIIAPKAGPMVDVISIAKTNLKKGETLDRMGGFKTYGVCENHEITKKENLLPIGLANKCLLTKDIKKDEPISYNDVILPENRLGNFLKKEQDLLFN